MEFKIDSKLAGMITLIGIMMVVMAVFFAWLDADEISATGLQLDNPLLNDGWQKSIPMIISVLGVVILALEMIAIIVPETSEKIEKILPVIIFVISLIVIILCIVFAMWEADPAGLSETGAGCWIAMIGGIICLLGSAGQAIPAFMKAVNKG